MNIVFYQFTPHYGGADRCTVEFAEQLKKHANVKIIDPFGTCETYKKAVEKAGIEYHVIWPQKDRTDIGGWGNPFARFFSLVMYLPKMFILANKTKIYFAKNKPDVLCTHNFKSGLVLYVNKYLRKIPTCYYLHNWYRPPQMTKIGKYLLRNHAKGVIGVSYSTMHSCVHAGVQWGKLFALYNPINVSDIKARSEHELEKPLPKLNRKVRILLPAGLLRIKGHLVAVRAMKILKDAGVDTVLWFAGDFQKVGLNSNYVDEIQKEIKDNNVEDYVEFIGMRHDLPRVMKESTILILPSILEGHPRVILEGMALKKPWIVTPAAGSLDMVSPGLTGYLMRFNSHVDLANAIIKIITEPVKTSQMVATAYEWVKEEFTPEDHAKVLYNYLKTLK